MSANSSAPPPSGTCRSALSSSPESVLPSPTPAGLTEAEEKLLIEREKLQQCRVLLAAGLYGVAPVYPHGSPTLTPLHGDEKNNNKQNQFSLWLPIVDAGSSQGVDDAPNSSDIPADQKEGTGAASESEADGETDAEQLEQNENSYVSTEEVSVAMKNVIKSTAVILSERAANVVRDDTIMSRYNAAVTASLRWNWSVQVNLGFPFLESGALPATALKETQGGKAAGGRVDDDVAACVVGDPNMGQHVGSFWDHFNGQGIAFSPAVLHGEQAHSEGEQMTDASVPSVRYITSTIRGLHALFAKMAPQGQAEDDRFGSDTKKVFIKVYLKVGQSAPVVTVPLIDPHQVHGIHEEAAGSNHRNVSATKALSEMFASAAAKEREQKVEPEQHEGTWPVRLGEVRCTVQAPLAPQPDVTIFPEGISPVAFKVTKKADLTLRQVTEAYEGVIAVRNKIGIATFQAVKEEVAKVPHFEQLPVLVVDWLAMMEKRMGNENELQKFLFGDSSSDEEKKSLSTKFVEEAVLPYGLDTRQGGTLRPFCRKHSLLLSAIDFIEICFEERRKPTAKETSVYSHGGGVDFIHNECFRVPRRNGLMWVAGECAVQWTHDYQLEPSLGLHLEHSAPTGTGKRHRAQTWSDSDMLTRTYLYTFGRYVLNVLNDLQAEYRRLETGPKALSPLLQPSPHVLSGLKLQVRDSHALQQSMESVVRFLTACAASTTKKAFLFNPGKPKLGQMKMFRTTAAAQKATDSAPRPEYHADGTRVMVSSAPADPPGTQYRSVAVPFAPNASLIPPLRYRTSFLSGERMIWRPGVPSTLWWGDWPPS